MIRLPLAYMRDELSCISLPLERHVDLARVCFGRLEEAVTSLELYLKGALPNHYDALERQTITGSFAVRLAHNLAMALVIIRRLVLGSEGQGTGDVLMASI